MGGGGGVTQDCSQMSVREKSEDKRTEQVITSY